MEKHLTTTASETQQLGEAFAKRVEDGSVVLLFGNLGAGKTTFVQGVAKGLGIEKRIISPTFVILRTYVIPNWLQHDRSFYHVDLYRLEGTRHELEEIGLLDLLQNPKNIIIIEWPEKMKAFLPTHRWEIHFNQTNENEREIIMKEYA